MSFAQLIGKTIIGVSTNTKSGGGGARLADTNKVTLKDTEGNEYEIEVELDELHVPHLSLKQIIAD